MTNFAKVLEAREENDPKTEAYYQGKLDTLHWLINTTK